MVTRSDDSDKEAQEAPPGCKVPGTKKSEVLQSVGIEPTLLRTRALSVRLNRSAKTAILQELAGHHVDDICVSS